MGRIAAFGSRQQRNNNISGSLTFSGIWENIQWQG
jgi:hypothetical protein